MRYILIFIISFLSFNISFSQDLFDLISNNEKTIYPEYFFKGTKIINSQSVEIPDEGVLQFMIQHRFGTLNSGFYNLFGLDNSQVRIGFDYGLNKWISLGVGRSSSLKALDSNLKFRLTKQSSGKISFPITVVFNTSVVLKQFLFRRLIIQILYFQITSHLLINFLSHVNLIENLLFNYLQAYYIIIFCL